MAMTGEKFTGENLAITWDSDDIEGTQIVSAEIRITRPSYEQTGASDDAAGKKPGKPDYTLRFEFRKSTRDADDWTTFDETEAAKAFTIYPNGNTAGEPTRTGNAFVIGATEGISYNGVTPFTVECDVDGAITRGSVSA